MKKFYILCNGGFGNRYLGLLNGLYIAYKAQLEPCVIWPVNNWCRAEFTDLFESELKLAKDFDYTSLINSGNTLNIFHNNFFRPDINWIPALTANINVIVDAIKNRDSDVFTGSDRLAPYVDQSTLVHGLMPVLPLCQNLVDWANQFKNQHLSNHYYGLHIRKTDAAHYVNESQLAQVIEKNPDKSFFVCSDDQNTEKFYNEKPNVVCNLKQHYVEKLVPGAWNDMTVDDSGTGFAMNVDRSKHSVISAIHDLLLLSYSDLSYNTSAMSSFLTVARLFKLSYEK